MYSQELKERFLENLNGYAEGTLKNYRYILGIAHNKAEKILNKDVYEFTFSECEDLLKSYSNKSLDMTTVNKSCLETYVDYCIQEGYVPTRINYFSGLSRQDLMKYVDHSSIHNRYLSYEELLDLEKQCVNAQDAVVVRLLFLGVRGEECSEILNLKVDDVKTDKIVLPDREIPIDSSTFDLIYDATTQKEYLRGNGEVSPRSKTDRMAINDSEYVMRPSGSTKSGQLNYQTFRMRVNRIKDYFGNPYLNIRNIWFSGIINQLKEIKKQNGSLTKQDYINVHKQYGYAEGYIFKTMAEVEKYL